MFDLSAYLARVQLPARVTVDAVGLQRLQRAHRLAIPFETLDIHLGRPILIDSDAVFAKLVVAKRGGFCFEHHRLFADALAAQGFTARPLLARVWLGAAEVPPRNHVLSLVHVDGEDWIADPGFGGSYAPAMPLADGVEMEGPDGACFRLSADADHGFMLWRDGPGGSTDGRWAGDGWQRQYSFTLDPVFDADLAMGSHWSATEPHARFVKHRVVTLPLPTGFASLVDRRYRRRAGNDETAAEISDPRVYRLRLSLMFGIDLKKEEVAALELF